MLVRVPGRARVCSPGLTPPPCCGQVDFEGELAIIIGRDCKNVSVDEALNYVLGYVPGEVPPSYLVRSRCALRHAHTQVHDRKRRQRTAVAREEGRWSVVPLQSVRYVLSAGAWCRAVQRGGPRQLAYHHTVERRGDAGFKHVGHGTCGWHGWLMVGVLLTGCAKRNAGVLRRGDRVLFVAGHDATARHSDFDRHARGRWFHTRPARVFVARRRRGGVHRRPGHPGEPRCG